MFDFKFDWDASINIGVEEIDKQHQELFSIVRDMEQLIITGAGGLDEEGVLAQLCRIREYITYHFYTEEKIIEDLHRDYLEEHRNKHEAFKKKINAIDCRKLVNNPMAELKEIRSLLQEWFFEHILIEDRKIISCE